MPSYLQLKPTFFAMSCAPTFADSKKALPESFGINTTLISFAAFLAVPAADAGAVLPAADAVDVVLPLLQPAKVERIIAVASVIAINLRMVFLYYLYQSKKAYEQKDSY